MTLESTEIRFRSGLCPRSRWGAHDAPPKPTSDGEVETPSHSPHHSSLQPQFSLIILLCLRSDTRHYGHFNRCSYLLTYLHPLMPSASWASRLEPASPQPSPLSRAFWIRPWWTEASTPNIFSLSRCLCYTQALLLGLRDGDLRRVISTQFSSFSTSKSSSYLSRSFQGPTVTLRYSISIPVNVGRPVPTRPTLWSLPDIVWLDSDSG